MSYQVLARKWRPKSFATLVGQEHVVKALTHALDQQRLHHAYLFTGTRGVGKTTLARIMAKALNCETGVSSTPCGICSSCVEIDGGRFIDYMELDAASNRGVEDMTSLLEKAVYAPTRGRFKVYVIDEVHQLSGHAFNAMLKTLEEPPEHVKFILATTDPQKIPATVLSRCLQFNLKQMPPGYIVDHLARILEAEQVPFEPAALRHLAKAAAGSMRDGLSLLDQAIAHGAGSVEEAGVRDMLGTVGDDYLFGILDGLAKGDLPAMLAVAEAMDERSLAFDSALQELATLFHRVALIQFSPQAVIDDAERQRLSPFAAAFEAEFLQLCYQIAIHGRDDLPLAPDEYAGFTMTLLRLFAFRPETAGRAAAPKVPTPRAMPASRPAAAAVAAVPAVVAPAVAPVADDDWHALVARLPLTGLPKQLAQHCELAELGEGQITLRLPPAHKALLAKMPQDKLQAELQGHFGRPLKLNILLAETEGETPAQRASNDKRERQEKAIAAIEQDPFVREAIDLFDASIDESTIKPI
jgi:DNA polymerase-3 subunit gamma/tau